VAPFPFPSSKRFSAGKGNSTFLEASALPLYISAKDIGFCKIGAAPPTVPSPWRRRRSKSETGLEKWNFDLGFVCLLVESEG
jgi:hypothetical protein